MFHPASVPVDRTARDSHKRRGIYRYCLYTAIAGLAIVGAAVLFGSAYLAHLLLNDLFFPTKQHALPTKHVERYNASQVHPLIGKSSPFDIQAIVWQDVTDLLASGQSLPERDAPWKLVQDTVWERSARGVVSNHTRTEAVLWSGVIAHDAHMRSKIHASIPLMVPVAPLYTSNLGSSSLRATFSIAIPERRTEEYGSFRNVSSVFTSDLPILPRRTDHTEHGSEQAFNTALADAGISTSLLELVPSPWYRTDAEGEAAGRTVNNGTRVNPFFSAHHTNLCFLDHARERTAASVDEALPEYRDADSRILLPHFRTRSRLGMVRTTDVFDKAAFDREHLAGRISMRSTCSNFWGGNCNRTYRWHSFETLLEFTRKSKSAEVGDAGDELHYYYAPALTQVSTPGSPRYQRRIPQRKPTSDQQTAELPVLRSNASAECEISPARLDDSGRYFELDWQIYFSTHTLGRVSVAESGFTTIMRPPPAPLRPGEEDGKQLIANSVVRVGIPESIDKTLTGDRTHANDHPARIALSTLVAFVWYLISEEFRKLWLLRPIGRLCGTRTDISNLDPDSVLFFFWYTRRTSAGLWIEAQWGWVALKSIGFVSSLIRPMFAEKSQGGFSVIGMLLQIVSLLHVFFVVTTLLHLERPPKSAETAWWRRNPLAFRRRRLTRRERKSIALADSIDKKPFYLVSSSLPPKPNGLSADWHPHLDEYHVQLLAVYFIFACVQDHRYLQFSAPDLCEVGDFGSPVKPRSLEAIFDRASGSLLLALLQIHDIAQAWFNRCSGTFTGSFKISVIGTAIAHVVLTIFMAMETFSDLPHKNLPSALGVGSLLELVAPLWLAYQAATMKGVPQVEPADEDDE